MIWPWTKPISTLVDPHRMRSLACWYCAGQLPNTFTSVRKGGQDCHVHYGCKSAAEDLIALDVPVLIEEQPDYGECR